MTEVAVLGAVMVPMLTLMPLLGKVSDINQSTIQASRYAAWERTLHDGGDKSDSRLAVEVSNLFFSKQDEPIRTNEDLLTGDDHQNNMWTGYGKVDDKQTRLIGGGSGGLKSYVSTVNESLPGGVSGTLNNATNKIFGTMARLIPGASWDMERNGLYVARVGTNVSSNSILTGTKDCENNNNEDVFSCIRRHNAILVDSWESSGSAQTKSRVKAMVPSGALEPISNVTKVLGWIPFSKELGRLDDEALGYVSPDVLPPDRYGN